MCDNENMNEKQDKEILNNDDGHNLIMMIIMEILNK